MEMFGQREKEANVLIVMPTSSRFVVKCDLYRILCNFRLHLRELRHWNLRPMPSPALLSLNFFILSCFANSRLTEKFVNENIKGDWNHVILNAWTLKMEFQGLKDNFWAKAMKKRWENGFAY